MATEPTAKHREEARELIGNVNNYADEHSGELFISAFGPLSKRIAERLSARDAEIERLRGWQEGLAGTTVAWSEQRLSRDREIREVLEGLKAYRSDCWCSPDGYSHSKACEHTQALWSKLNSTSDT